MNQSWLWLSIFILPVMFSIAMVVGHILKTKRLKRFSNRWDDLYVNRHPRKHQARLERVYEWPSEPGPTITSPPFSRGGRTGEPPIGGPASAELRHSMAVSNHARPLMVESVPDHIPYRRGISKPRPEKKEKVEMPEYRVIR